MVSISAAVLSLNSSANELPPQLAAKIDAIFAQYGQDSPGCTVGVSIRDQTLLRAYGLADLERNVKLTPDSIVESGSVAKQFTAAAILLLARDKKLSLDDPVRKYIPELPDYTTPLTIRHALHHTAGLRDWGGLVAMEGWPRGERNFTNAHAVALLSRQKSLNFMPGTNWSYSNSGYILAAEIVARVSGMTFAQFSEERLFKPMGLTHTRWRDDHTQLVKNRALAYAPVRSSSQSSASAVRYRLDMPNESVVGAGGLLTTVADLTKWMQSMGTPGFFDATFLEEMHKRATFAGSNEVSYSLGLEHNALRETPEIHHGGATAGYRTHASVFPAHGLAVAVLCNAANAAPGTLLQRVVSAALEGKIKNFAPRTATHMWTAEERSAFVGLYKEPKGTGARRLLLDRRDSAVLRVENGPTLLAQSPTTALLPEGTRIELTNRGIKTTAPRGATLDWERTAAWAPNPTELKAYGGDI